ncbi:MAG: cyclic-di-AMP receptor [Clostridia bacterium]|jgi:uncharacterized protein YaaQ|nr:cyclic-di-AMP receptor [Clostridia bacterium]NLV34062.1 hypothetical protein [Clostridiaceae bacterium]OQB52663.1 MAG: hypothetical protein BWX97_01207 [Firmicutes bacterium ADurb.Bin146]MDD4501507.1 cyclic-di-AMP receptor [Clostridia bacterium]HOD93140.1 cyclic-di-AMP receptor [Clostridia bacterium]
MKLIFAIVNDEDELDVMRGLSQEGYGVTKLCSTGGFLKSGNTTLLIGVDDEKMDHAIEIIKTKSKSRKKIVNSSMIGSSQGAVLTGYPIEITMGGATIFVTDVIKYIKE